MYDMVLRGGNVYLDFGFDKTNVYIKDGVIALISDEMWPADIVRNVHGKEVLPGIIDPHVHFELDLGFAKSVDDFYSGSKAGAYGGVTSFIDFLDPVDNAEALKEAYQKRVALAKKSVLDYAFHATLKNPKGDLEPFVKTMKSLDIHTLKIFTTYSESGRKTEEEAIIELLKLSKKYNFMLLAHIESDALIDLNPLFKPSDLLTSRPSESETLEAVKMASLVAKYGGKMYMVHTSSGNTIERLKQTFPAVLNQSFLIESCPQYFTFTADKLQQEDGYLYTFAPPLRTEEERQKLFEYSRYIDAIGTDHCAFMAKDKNQKLLKDTPLGVGSIEHSFNIMRHHLGPACIPLMTSRPAALHRLPKKGRIALGYDADFVVFQPADNWIITTNHAASDYSIYHKLPGSGRVMDTIVRGEFVVKNSQFIRHKGKLIDRRNPS